MRKLLLSFFIGLFSYSIHAQEGHEIKINLKNFVPEFSIRLLYLLICILIIKDYKPSESENSYLIAFLFVLWE